MTTILSVVVIVAVFAGMILFIRSLLVGSMARGQGHCAGGGEDRQDFGPSVGSDGKAGSKGESGDTFGASPSGTNDFSGGDGGGGDGGGGD